MPYLLISTQVHTEVGPTPVGDEHSAPELIQYLGASKRSVLGNKTFLSTSSVALPAWSWTSWNMCWAWQRWARCWCGACTTTDSLTLRSRRGTPFLHDSQSWASVHSLSSPSLPKSSFSFAQHHWAVNGLFWNLPQPVGEGRALALGLLVAPPVSGLAKGLRGGHDLWAGWGAHKS